jgi:hypothetical protein
MGRSSSGKDSRASALFSRRGDDCVGGLLTITESPFSPISVPKLDRVYIQPSGLWADGS